MECCAKRGASEWLRRPRPGYPGAAGKGDVLLLRPPRGVRAELAGDAVERRGAAAPAGSFINTPSAVV
jgi:hypothetical protein